MNFNNMIDLKNIVFDLTQGIIKSNPMTIPDINWGNPIATGKEKDQVYLAVKNSNLLKQLNNITVSQSINYHDDIDLPFQDNSPNSIDIVIPNLWKLEVKVFRRMGGKSEETNWFNHLYETDFYTTNINKKDGQSAVGDIDKLIKLKNYSKERLGIIIMVFTNSDIKRNGNFTNFNIEKYINLFELITCFKYLNKIDLNLFKTSKTFYSSPLIFDEKKSYINGLKRKVDKNFHNQIYTYGWEIKRNSIDHN